MEDIRDWIVIVGNLLNSPSGNSGFEFMGPYTHQEAQLVRAHLRRAYGRNGVDVCSAVQLIGADIPESIKASLAEIKENER